MERMTDILTPSFGFAWAAMCILLFIAIMTLLIWLMMPNNKKEKGDKKEKMSTLPQKIYIEKEQVSDSLGVWFDSPVEGWDIAYVPLSEIEKVIAEKNDTIRSLTIALAESRKTELCRRVRENR